MYITFAVLLYDGVWAIIGSPFNESFNYPKKSENKVSFGDNEFGRLMFQCDFGNLLMQFGTNPLFAKLFIYNYIVYSKQFFQQFCECPLPYWVHV